MVFLLESNRFLLKNPLLFKPFMMPCCRVYRLRSGPQHHRASISQWSWGAFPLIKMCCSNSTLSACWKKKKLNLSNSKAYRAKKSPSMVWQIPHIYTSDGRTEQSFFLIAMEICHCLPQFPNNDFWRLISPLLPSYLTVSWKYQYQFSFKDPLQSSFEQI